MRTLTRPEGTEPSDLDLSRRALGLAAFGGYAVFAFSAEAAPIHTDAEGLVEGMVQVDAGDRMIPAYQARPAAKGRYPVVVVICEVFGIHEYIRDTCRRLAKLGYAAIAPDFFVRAGDPSVISDFAQIRRIVSTATDKQVMNDLNATLRFIKAQPYADKGHMAITGFCWGGAIAWLACERSKDFKAGVALDHALDQAGGVGVDGLGLGGEGEHRIAPERRQAERPARQVQVFGLCPFRTGEGAHDEVSQLKTLPGFPAAFGAPDPEESTP